MPVLTVNSISISHSANESAWWVIVLLKYSCHSDNRNIIFQTGCMAWSS